MREAPEPKTSVWVMRLQLNNEDRSAMVTPDELLGAVGSTAVADSFALYQIATSHTSAAVVIRGGALSGAIRLVASSEALAVASGMRTCWDDECTWEHAKLPGIELRSFHEQGGFDLVRASVIDTVAAGQAYANCADRRLVGPEVLASCFSSQIAESLDSVLLSTVRGSYCYGPKSAVSGRTAIHLI
ncbi:hypothetical protein [Streptomyces sp. YIM S03343]